MRRLHWLTLASLGVLAACRQPDSALRVDITIKSTPTARVRAECVKLAVLVNGEQTKSLIVARPSDDTLVFGILKTPDLPQTISLQVSGLVGSPCTDETALQLNARGPVLEATFPTSGVQPFAMELEPPGRNLDGDADGYVGSSFGGPDCRDNDAQVFPGAVQICNSQNDTDCDGVVGCDDPGCSAAPFCADQATKLVLLSIPRDIMERGECLGPINLQLQNAFGRRVAVRDTPVVFTQSISGVTVHATATCMDTALSTLSVPYDSAELPPIYLSADETAFGTNTFRATADRVAMPATTTVEVHPRPYTSVKFASPPQTLTAGTCGATPVTLELLDSQMRRTDVDRLTTIQLRSSPEDLNGTPIFFSDANCSTNTMEVTLTPGQGRATVYLLARRAGTITLTATPPTAPGVTGDTQTLTVTPSTPTRLAFTNMPLALQTTVLCSSATLDVELQDQFGNRVPVAQTLGLSFDVTNNYPLQFFAASDTNCNVALTSFAIPMGMSRASLRLRASLATPALTVTVSAVSPPSPLASASQMLNVSTGAASKFTWRGMPQTPLAGVCSAMPLTLELLDTVNNPSSLTMPLTFALSATLGTPTQNPIDTTFRFYSGAGCQTDLNGSLTIPANTSQAQIYFRANKVRTNFEVRATGTLTGPDMPSTGHSVLANVPANLTFSAANLAQTAAAGACSPNPYTLNVTDQYGNPTSFSTQQTVTVTSSPSGVLVGLAPACDAGNSVTLNAGATNTIFNARATRVPSGNTYQLGATVGSLSTSSMMAATLTVTPATPELVATPAGPITLVANLGNCQNISLVRQDTYLNPAPTSGTFNLGVTAPSGAFDIFPQQDCNGTAGAAIPMNSASTVAFSVRARQAGTHLLQFAAQGATTSLNVTITPGSPIFQFTTPMTGNNMASTSIQAGGCAAVTLARRDTFGNDVPLPSASALTFTTTDPSVTVHSAPGCTSPTTSIAMAAGESSKPFYVKGTSTTQVWTVGATLATQSATLSLTVTPGNSMLSFVAPTNGMANVVANDCVVVTIKREDSQGNAVPIPAGVTTATLGVTGSISVFDNSTCTLPTVTGSIPVTPGTSTKTFSVRATQVGTPSILITLNGQPVTLNVSVGPGMFSTLVLENVPASLTAGGCSTPGVVVRRRDFFNNDITTDPTLTVNLTSTGFGFSATPTSCANPQTTATVTITTGSAVSAEPVYLTGTLAAPLVTVTAASTSPMASIVANSAIVPGSPTQLVFTNMAGTVTVPGCGTPLTVELRDVHGNRVTPSSNYNVTLSSTLAAGFFPRGACMAPASTTLALTSAQPVGTFSFLPTASGTHTVGVSGAGPLSSSQMWTVNPGPAARLAWRTVPTAAPARFACVAAGLVESRDNNGNLTVVSTDTTVTLTSSVASLQFFSDASCTTPANTTVIPSGQDVAPGLFMFATGGAANVTLSSSPSLTAPALVTVTPGAPSGSLVVTTGSPNLEAGGCTAITVTRKDDQGADLSKGTTLATLASGAASVELHTNATCTAAVTSPAPLTFAHGTSALSTLWAKGKSAAPATATTAATVTLTAASTGSTNGTTNLTVYPLVRRGSCNLADTEGTKRCVVSATNPPFPAVDISRSFLVFTSNGRPATGGGTNSIDAANQNVECHLDTNGGTSVDVVCSRQGTALAMNVNYQVVSFGRDAASGQGISVQHFNQLTSTTVATTSITLTPAVDATKSFFLASNTLEGGSNNAEGFPLVRFPSQTGSQATVEVVSPTAAPTGRLVSVQVVTLGWATAVTNHTQANAPMLTGANYDIGTPMISTSFPLVMATAADGSTPDAMCKRRLNARGTSTTNVRLHRGSATQPAGCIADAVTAANVQRVFFPGQSVNVTDVNFTTNATSANTSSFGAVAKDRALTFLAMQGPGGQAGGESNYLPSPNPDADDLGAFNALLDFNGAGTQVVVARTIPSVSIAATFSVYVVVFDP